MKPTIKLPYAEFMANAISNFSKHYPSLHLVPGSMKYMKNHAYDGPSECYEIPEYIEVEIEALTIE